MDLQVREKRKEGDVNIYMARKSMKVASQHGEIEERRNVRNAMICLGNNLTLISCVWML